MDATVSAPQPPNLALWSATQPTGGATSIAAPAAAQASCRPRRRRRRLLGCPLTGMDKLIIQGGAPLCGTVAPAGNKNGALAVIAASVLTDAELHLGNVPRIRDVDAMLEIVEGIGVSVDWHGEND